MEYSIPDEIMGQLDTQDFNYGEEDMDGTVISVVRAGKPVKKAKKFPDPITFLKEVMYEKGLRNKDLKIYIGSSGNVSAVLKRRQALSLRMIRNLNKYLDIPAEILIQPYDCR
jgi:HTH-type transcriptional regulator/antitoxin HigA